MKNYITLAFFVLSFTIIAQDKVDEFKITPTGFNGFVVNEFPDKSASDLYTEVIKWSEYNISNAKVSNKSNIENEYLSYNLYYPDGLKVKNGITYVYWDVMVKVEFRFKDGKIRFDNEIISMDMKPSASRQYSPSFQYSGGMTTWSFFNRKGKPKKLTQSARDQIEVIANDIVASVTDAVNGKSVEKTSDW